MKASILRRPYEEPVAESSGAIEHVATEKQKAPGDGVSTVVKFTEAYP